MLLTSLVLENFKPFGTRQEIPLAPITLIYGPNSGGKSSIIQALLLLKQSLRPDGPYVDLGSFRSLIHAHDLSRELKLELAFCHSYSSGRFTRRRKELSHYPDQVPGCFRIGLTSTAEGECTGALSGLHYEQHPAGKSRRHHGFEVGFEWSASDSTRSLFGGRQGKWVPSGDLKSLVEFLAQRAPASSSAAARRKAVASILESASLTGGGVAPFNFNCESTEDTKTSWIIRSEAKTVFEDFGQAVQDALQEIEHVGPQRGTIGRYQPIPVKKQVFRSPSSVGEELASSPSAMDDLNRWFKLLEIPYTASARPVDPDGPGDLAFLELSDSNGVKLSYQDVGYGIGQVMPILVQAASSGILCVEQPELHLHPRLQAELGDFFITTALGDEDLEITPKQWIIESHSEALIRRIQRRIRSKVLDNRLVKVLYVRPIHDKGSFVSEIAIDTNGEFSDSWPDGFFDINFNEVFCGN